MPAITDHNTRKKKHYFKKCSLQRFLNTEGEVADERMEMGSAFHKRGNETKTELINAFVRAVQWRYLSLLTKEG